MTIPRVAALSFAAGTAAAIGWMATYAARAAYTITSGHRWYQLKVLRGK